MKLDLGEHGVFVGFATGDDCGGDGVKAAAAGEEEGEAREQTDGLMETVPSCFVAPVCSHLSR